jgi:threonine synthase
MSPFQQAQMYALTDANIHNLAIDGVFDDCQDIVKAVNADAAFKARYASAPSTRSTGRASRRRSSITSAAISPRRRQRSVRRLRRAVGQFRQHSGWTRRERDGPADPPARRSPTNENDVLDEFFRTGRYRPRAASETHATSSPSMDISKASNFERYIFDVVGRDPAIVRDLWQRLVRNGEFDLSRTDYAAAIARSGFVSGKSTHADRIATIRDVARKFGVIVDPHTADGLKVGIAHRDPRVPMICLETALPAKFAATIREALGHDPSLPAAYADLARARSVARGCRRICRKSRRTSRRTPRRWRRGGLGRAG